MSPLFAGSGDMFRFKICSRHARRFQCKCPWSSDLWWCAILRSNPRPHRYAKRCGRARS